MRGGGDGCGQPTLPGGVPRHLSAGPGPLAPPAPASPVPVTGVSGSAGTLKAKLFAGASVPPAFCSQALPFSELLFGPHPFPAIPPSLPPQIQPPAGCWPRAGCRGSAHLHPARDASQAANRGIQVPSLTPPTWARSPPAPHAGRGTRGLSRSCRPADGKFKDVLDGSLGIGLYFYSLYVNATQV